jgi:hypothetical protein
VRRMPKTALEVVACAAICRQSDPMQKLVPLFFVCSTNKPIAAPTTTPMMRFLILLSVQ